MSRADWTLDLISSGHRLELVSISYQPIYNVENRKRVWLLRVLPLFIDQRTEKLALLGLPFISVELVSVWFPQQIATGSEE